MVSKSSQLAIEFVRFENSLLEFGADDLSEKSTSRLLVDAALLRQGKASDATVRYYKRAVLKYIHEKLEPCSKNDVENFFLFLLKSELVNDSSEIRAALHGLLTKLEIQPVSRLAMEIALALIRSEKSPTANVIETWFKKAHDQFRNKPDWTLVGFLAACIGRPAAQAYTAVDLVDDVARLNGPGFDKAVRIRNPIWMSVQSIPRIDAITIINEVARRQPGQVVRRPLSTLDLSLPKRSDMAYQPQAS